MPLTVPVVTWSTHIQELLGENRRGSGAPIGVLSD
jgi:hypothetical protein